MGVGGNFHASDLLISLRKSSQSSSLGGFQELAANLVWVRPDKDGHNYYSGTGSLIHWVFRGDLKPTILD